MHIKNCRSVAGMLLVLPCLILIFSLNSCYHENKAIAKAKLDLILPDDLKAIVQDIPKEGLADKPYYEITSYKTFKKGMYTAKAEVDFYFLKKVKYKVTRKFRYDASQKMWERYFNEYMPIPDSLSVKETK